VNDNDSHLHVNHQCPKKAQSGLGGRSACACRTEAISASRDHPRLASAC